MKYDTPGIKYDLPGVTYDNPALFPLTYIYGGNMAQDQTKKLDPKVIAADITSLQALTAITGYTPANPACALPALNTVQTAMTAAQALETQKQADADAARDAAVKAEWAFHNAMLAAKDQVKAQFGADSDEWQALGMTKKSERKKPVKKSKGTTGTK